MSARLCKRILCKISDSQNQQRSMQRSASHFAKLFAVIVQQLSAGGDILGSKYGHPVVPIHHHDLDPAVCLVAASSSIQGRRHSTVASGSKTHLQCGGICHTVNTQPNIGTQTLNPINIALCKRCIHALYQLNAAQLLGACNLACNKPYDVTFSGSL